ncbi:MAG TPA: TonB family protein [bacterium]|nr:TonB family protein [bacterium]
MQYREYRTGDTDRTSIEKKSTGISFFIHMVGISFLLISPVKKQINKNDVFTVHIVDIPVIPAPQVVSPPLEKPAVEPPPGIEKKGQKEKLSTVKEKPIKTQETTQKKEIPTFSAEKFRESLIAKAGVSQTPDKASLQKPPEPVKIEKIEREVPEITISSLMSIPDWYLSTIHKKIKENWRTDNIIGERTAIVSFRVYRDGRIENISLEKSSGNTRFDRSVLEAVISTKQVPPFPVEITYNYLDIIIDFKTEG